MGLIVQADDIEFLVALFIEVAPLIVVYYAGFSSTLKNVHNQGSLRMRYESILIGYYSIDLCGKERKVFTLHDCQAKSRVTCAADAETVLDSHQNGVLSERGELKSENILKYGSLVLQCPLVTCHYK